MAIWLVAHETLSFYLPVSWQWFCNSSVRTYPYSCSLIVLFSGFCFRTWLTYHPSCFILILRHNHSNNACAAKMWLFSSPCCFYECLSRIANVSFIELRCSADRGCVSNILAFFIFVCIYVCSVNHIFKKSSQSSFNSAAVACWQQEFKFMLLLWFQEVRFQFLDPEKYNLSWLHCIATMQSDAAESINLDFLQTACPTRKAVVAWRQKPKYGC